MSYLENVERHFYGTSQSDISQTGPRKFEHINQIETRRRQKNYEDRKLKQQIEEEEYRKKVLAERHQRIQEITEKYQRATYVKRRPQTTSSRLMHLKSIYCQRMMTLNKPRRVSSTSPNYTNEDIVANSSQKINFMDKSAKYDVYRVTSASSDGSERSVNSGSLHASPITKIQEDVSNGLRKNKVNFTEKRYTPEPKLTKMKSEAHLVRPILFQPPKDTFEILREQSTTNEIHHPTHQLSISRSPFSQNVFLHSQSLITAQHQTPPQIQKPVHDVPKDPIPHPPTSFVENSEEPKTKSLIQNYVMKQEYEYKVPEIIKKEFETKNVITRPKSSRPTMMSPRVPELVTEISDDISIDLVIPSSEISSTLESNIQSNTTKNTFSMKKNDLRIFPAAKNHPQTKLTDNDYDIADNSFLSSRLHNPKNTQNVVSNKVPKGILKKSSDKVKKSNTVVFDSIELTKQRSKTFSEDPIKSVRFADQNPTPVGPQSSPHIVKDDKNQRIDEMTKKAESTAQLMPESEHVIKKTQPPSYIEKYKKIPVHVPLIVDKKPLFNPANENQILRIPNAIDFDGTILTEKNPSIRPQSTSNQYNRTGPTSDKRPACTFSGKYGSSQSLSYILGPPKSSSIPKKSNTRVNSLPTLDSIAFFNAAEKYVNYDNLSMSLMSRLVQSASSNTQTNPSVLSIEENRLMNSLDKLDEKLKKFQSTV